MHCKFGIWFSCIFVAGETSCSGGSCLNEDLLTVSLAATLTDGMSVREAVCLDSCPSPVTELLAVFSSFYSIVSR